MDATALTEALRLLQQIREEIEILSDNDHHDTFVSNYIQYISYQTDLICDWINVYLHIAMKGITISDIKDILYIESFLNTKQLSEQVSHYYEYGESKYGERSHLNAVVVSNDIVKPIPIIKRPKPL